jgi:hypothetical protein
MIWSAMSVVSTCGCPSARANKVAMAWSHAAHQELVQAELDFYAHLVVKQVVATGGASNAVGPSASTSSADSSAVVHEFLSNMEMDTNFWESIIHEADEDSEGDEFWD